MDWRTKDSELRTRAEMTERIRSLDRRRENLPHPKDPMKYGAFQATLATLAARSSALVRRRAVLIRDGRDSE